MENVSVQTCLLFNKVTSQNKGDDDVRWLTGHSGMVTSHRMTQSRWSCLIGPDWIWLKHENKEPIHPNPQHHPTGSDPLLSAAVSWFSMGGGQRGGRLSSKNWSNMKVMNIFYLINLQVLLVQNEPEPTVFKQSVCTSLTRSDHENQKPGFSNQGSGLNTHTHTRCCCNDADWPPEVRGVSTDFPGSRFFLTWNTDLIWTQKQQLKLFLLHMWFIWKGKVHSGTM